MILFLQGMEHEKYMRRCLQLASNGSGRVSPNPMVGSLVVYKDRIIGEGWHQKAGLPHAEVNAINAVKEQHLLEESTLYVNLEPCAHFGKTPPCSDLIIEKRIPKVVVGCRDPFSEVNGKGIKKLENAGVEVTEGILQKECEALNKRFFTFHGKKRPYIILKWAQTADGFMDIERKHSKRGINWITSLETRTLVHKWRAEEDAIMVGAQTVVNDNPTLTVRDVAGENPVRIVLNKGVDIPKSSAVFNEEAPSLYFTSEEKTTENLIILKPEEDVLPQVLREAYNRNIQSILVEGGAFLLKSFIATGLWDEARVLIGSKKYFGSGLEAPKIDANPVSEEQIGADLLNVYCS